MHINIFMETRLNKLRIPKPIKSTINKLVCKKTMARAMAMAKVFAVIITTMVTCMPRLCSSTVNETGDGTAIYCLGPSDASLSQITESMAYGIMDNVDKLLQRDLTKESKKSIYFKTRQGEGNTSVFFFYLCDIKVTDKACNICVYQALERAMEGCMLTLFWLASVWLRDCMVHFSLNDSTLNRDFSFVNNILALASNTIYFPTGTLSRAIDNVTQTAASGSSRYAVLSLRLSNSTSLQARAQCVPELSASDCLACMRNITPMMPKSLDSTDLLGSQVIGTFCHVGYRFDSSGVSQLRPKGKREVPITWIAVVSCSAIGVCALLFTALLLLYKWRTRIEREKRMSEEILEIASRRRYKSSYDFSDMNLSETPEFGQLAFDTLSEATNGFSPENKLGEGGYGPVYKGVLPDKMTEIAVKKLSTDSAQGVEEFKNEVELIAKLQHRNLVKLLGYCLEKDENLLVYEYLPNRSLDFFIFESKGSNRQVQLDWRTRLAVITGIAKGLMYLHEDSRLNVVHRDLKAANVLLDADMNPKISDFGLARIFGPATDEANRTTPAGTPGYMAPEYIKEGSYSDKSDVFSFGVVLLEIISGKENRNFHKSKLDKSLIAYAWKLWSEGRERDLIDAYVWECVREECDEVEMVLRCVQVGLLCIQDEWDKRPSMSSVVLVLAHKTISLPKPDCPTQSIGSNVPMPYVSYGKACHHSNGFDSATLSPR